MFWDKIIEKIIREMFWDWQFFFGEIDFLVRNYFFSLLRNAFFRRGYTNKLGTR